jgi:hypothetical protein
VDWARARKYMKSRSRFRMRVSEQNQSVDGLDANLAGGVVSIQQFSSCGGGCKWRMMSAKGIG